MFKSLDHLAIVVRNTDEALKLYRDKLGLSVLFSEVLPDQPVRLTHLDMGNTHLQLVQPLTADHPLQAWLDEHGEGLHHFCFLVDSVEETAKELPEKGMQSQDDPPRSGPNGRKAAFIDRTKTNNVLIEITSES
ncbi:MAG: methylmalonyl-CoA epimerase [Anaerolineaceae bacterium]|nr:methylmalonyl-CoA epimerase [Anaerolineaceae bacterium]